MNPTACESNQILLTVQRQTKAYSSEEDFMIYQGTTATGTPVFSQPYIQDNTLVTWKVCVAKTAHTIHMTDSDNDGWTSSPPVNNTKSASSGVCTNSLSEIQFA